MLVIEGWERFCLSHPFLLHMCEVIIFGDDDFEMFNDNAMPYLRTLETFEFIFCLVTLQCCLYYLREAAVKLQGKNQDIVSGVLLIEQASKELRSLRMEIDDYSHQIFEHSCRIAEKSYIDVSMPRVSQRQVHRSNTEFRLLQKNSDYVLEFSTIAIKPNNSRFGDHSQARGRSRALNSYSYYYTTITSHSPQS